EAFLGLFSSHPLANVARGALTERLSRDDALECEALVSDMERSGADPSLAGRAVARLAAMMAQAGQTEVAAGYYQKLVDRYADVVCLNDQTGRQIVASIPMDSPIRLRLSRQTSWPIGSVTAQEGKSNSKNMSQRSQRSELEVLGSATPWF